MRWTYLIVGLAAGAVFAGSAKSSSYVNGQYGFSLTPPHFPDVEKRVATVFQTCAAPADGAEANLNVQVQPMNMTREEYRALSLKQFRKEGWTVTSEKDLTVSGRDAVLWDFEGKCEGEEYRWLSLAVIDKPRVILSTCTSLKRHFAAHEKEFRASLESFKMAE